MLGLAPATVRRYLREGRLPGRRRPSGRGYRWVVVSCELLEWIQANWPSTADLATPRTPTAARIANQVTRYRGIAQRSLGKGRGAREIRARKEKENGADPKAEVGS